MVDLNVEIIMAFAWNIFGENFQNYKKNLLI
jgi:hypothetical protein